MMPAHSAAALAGPGSWLSRLSSVELPVLSELRTVPNGLRYTAHRPWPLPPGLWIMRMTWEDLLFIHWPVPANVLRPLVPAALEIDTFEEQAWLTVTPLCMSGVRARAMPSFPWMSEFPELNVCTYVTLHNKPGVFFFSLDADSWLAVMMARLTYHLPYYRADMSSKSPSNTSNAFVRFISRRRHSGEPPAEFIARYWPTGPEHRSMPGSLEHFLTERYCLYAVGSQRRVYRGEIHHLPWPLQPAEAAIERNTMTQGLGIVLPDTPPLLHFAKRLEVIAWPATRVTNGQTSHET